MARYSLPGGMRYTSLLERKEFYEHEFNLRNVQEWFGQMPAYTKFAVIIGRHTKIFPEKYREDASTTIIVDEYKNLEDLRQQILEFLPEAVYYDRNQYDKEGIKIGQELAFDLDPENITCPIHGSLADKMKRRQGLSFCELELDMIKKETISLWEFLEKDYSQISAVYSGRGFHLHIIDQNAYTLSTKQRQKIAQEIKGTGFHIDEWVTTGEFRLIRLPYSLNGIVSRIALPLKKGEIEDFDAVSDKRCVPQFLQKTTS
jgi:DNA primase catalytic subunit